MNKTEHTISEIAKLLNGEIKGDQDIKINSVATLGNAAEGQISFLSNPKYINLLKTTKASVVLLTEQAASLCPTNTITITDPYLAFATIASLFDKSPKVAPGIESTASICETSEIHKNVCIGKNVVIGSYCKISEDVSIGANTTVSDYCTLSKNVKIKSNVAIYHDVRIGENTIIHANSVIGSDGFGNAKDAQGNWIKVPQLGGVTIGKNVEIGSSTTIDRGTIDDTVLHDGVKLDNQIQIAHNVIIGENTAMAAQVGVAGSTTIGKNCLFAGQVGVNGHITICDNVVIGAKSTVIKPIKEPGLYQSTIPVKPHMQWKRILAGIYKLDKMPREIRALRRKK
ncbi:MAG: UDP-3-O-[3-hydroxymyristoyl] glucosamine N-acyltransferase [Francisellaceae bacterium]|jgi:UDP-3-O-[3-hydroxymyristoyl] glucosamine N-acyltransferase